MKHGVHSRSSTNPCPAQTHCVPPVVPAPQALLHRVPTPGQERCPPHALRFSHKGDGRGLPWTGNILFSEWGEEEEREGHSRSEFLAFLAGACPAAWSRRCRGCWPSATLSWPGRTASHLRCLLDLGGQGTPLSTIPLTPGYHRSRQTLTQKGDLWAQ